MAIKKYPHAVIYKGVLYPANTEIEVKDQEVKTEPKKAVKKNDRATGEKS